MNASSNRIKHLERFTLVGGIVLLASCAATQTALEHRKLETQTQMSRTIFLDPVSAKQKTIYMQVKNTSDQTLDVNLALQHAFVDKGYRVVPHAEEAHYLLQVNILKVGKMSVAASQAALGGGYGSALAGIVSGASFGALSGNSTAVFAGGVSGGLVGLAADSLVKAVNYTMITDVQISERLQEDAKVRETHESSLNNGSSSNQHHMLSKNSQYQRYRTRVVSNADRVNLSFPAARPLLEEGLVKTLAGIL